MGRGRELKLELLLLLTREEVTVSITHDNFRVPVASPAHLPLSLLSILAHGMTM
jgi:hypothetical protein